jgi:hypothetical protein
MLQWCREQGCPWNAYTCANAAQNVHLNVLQWYWEKGALGTKKRVLMLL